VYQVCCFGSKAGGKEGFDTNMDGQKMVVVISSSLFTNGENWPEQLPHLFCGCTVLELKTHC
jgi:hypothetical protein